MKIPATSPTTLSTDPFSSSPHSVTVGELRFGERSYIVSIESSAPLISSPNSATIEKIQYLVDLHLNHLSSKGTDLSKIVLQQLDETGLFYVNEDLEQKSLQSSELKFVPFDPSDENSSYPISLQSELISSISDIYRSIMDSLTRETESQEAEITTSTTKSSARPIIFTPESEESVIENSNADPRVEESYSTHVSSSEEDHYIETDTEDDEAIETEDETRGLLTGEAKDDFIYNQNSIKSKLYNFGLNLWNSLPSLRKIDSNDEPIVNTQKIIEEEEMTFRSGMSESQKSDFDKFTTIKFQ